MVAVVPPAPGTGNLPAVYQIIKVCQGLSCGKPFLIGWESLPTQPAGRPGQAACQLIGSCVRVLPDGIQCLLQPQLMVVEQFPHATVEIAAPGAVGWKDAAHGQRADPFQAVQIVRQGVWDALP